MRIEDMDIDTLIELNDVICERIEYLRGMENMEMMQTLQIGSKVSFQNRDGQSVFGVIIKKNRKTVAILTADQRQWKVSPALLTPVKDVN